MVRTLLLSVGVLAVGYVLTCALVVFNMEQDSFDTFFDAVCWACGSLTTVGYDDIYPVSDLGRVVTRLSLLIGVVLRHAAGRHHHRWLHGRDAPGDEERTLVGL